jgi:hypothetical protein
VASVLAEGDGSGLVTTRSSAGETKLFSRSAEVGVAVHEVGKKRLELTKSPAGSFAVRAFNAGGLRVATFGATGEGFGVSSVGAGADWPLAAMTATDGRGAVQVLGPNGEPVVTLVDEAEGGKVQISSRAAVMLVEAGTESGRGFVRTGPGAYPSIFPFPISQIVGKK